MAETWKSYIRLCAIPEIGAVTAMRLINAFGSPEGVFAATREELTAVDKIGIKTADSIIENKDLIDMERICDKMNRLGARYLCFKDSKYPVQLKKIPDLPVGFYYIGECDFNSPCISIIGSRNCTVYGQIVAKKFAAAFARAGITVVSGMARGIDSAAHWGALEAGGKTIAVLGCGADVIYPPENVDLYKRIIESGAVVSEFPLGTRADKQTFPIRNRIVSGLSLATIVVESDSRGGSLITARLAGEQGRDVFAIPGRIDSDSSRGCNALIRDGATLATCPEDVLDSLKFSGQLQINFKKPAFQKGKTAPAPPSSNASKHQSLELGGDEAAIYECLKQYDSLEADEISEKSGLPIAKCLPALLMLEIKKIASKDAGGRWKIR